MSRRVAPRPCPCGSTVTFPRCCGGIIAGAFPAPTAERLMRSRFTAFSVGDADYLLRSWDPSTRPATLSLDDGTVWKRLTILEVSADDDGSTGIVEFAASYVHGGEPGTLRERSSFRRLDGAWVYVGPLS